LRTNNHRIEVTTREAIGVDFNKIGEVQHSFNQCVNVALRLATPACEQSSHAQILQGTPNFLFRKRQQ
jgi:hypothetical protein